MAQKVQTLFVDDIDGSDAEGHGLRFGLDGTHYEIDLNADHAGELAEHASRRTPRPAGESPALPTGQPGAWARPLRMGFSTTEVRDWAKANGVEIKGPRASPGGRNHPVSGRPPESRAV